MEQSELFGHPSQRTYELSNLLAAQHLRHDDELVRWGKVSTHRDCDECLANQYETQGRSGPRSPARMTRTVRGLGLMLCTRHGDLWKAKDRGE